MTLSPSRPTPSARPEARVVDLAAYRAARTVEDDALPLFARSIDTSPFPASAPDACRMSDRAVAHRERMLRHLTAVGDRG